MRAPSSIEKEFLNEWILGLQICTSAKQNMSILERKKAIKLSADIAMASAKNGRTCWSRALIANASKDKDNKPLVEQILAPEFEQIKKISRVGSVKYDKRVRSEKILKRSRCFRRVMRKHVLAKSIAKRLVQKRTQVLKSLIPGGEFMDDVSLIEEALDYIVSLRTQVDVMRKVTEATELANGY